MNEPSQAEAVIASPKPYYCELRVGRPIAWCRCGRSKRQPFCDGRSHRGTGFEPLVYRPRESCEEVLLCGRSEEHTSELQSLMRISYAVFCLKKTKTNNYNILITYIRSTFM